MRIAAALSLGVVLPPVTIHNYPLGEQQERVLELLRDRGPMTATAIANELEVILGRGYAILYALEDRGRVRANRHVRPTRWELRAEATP